MGYRGRISVASLPTSTSMSMDWISSHSTRVVQRSPPVQDRVSPRLLRRPWGMGAALLNFLPGRMTSEQYFRLNGLSEKDQAIRFFLGLSPAMLQRSYLADRQAVDFATHKGPSTVMACQICAGMAATEALKIMLKRGRVYAAPVLLQFDAYHGRLKRTWRPWGKPRPVAARCHRHRHSAAPAGCNETTGGDSSLCKAIVGFGILMSRSLALDACRRD
jgi:hypothetical protein